MGDNVTTAREALMAELLKDVDVVVRRIEQADAALADKIEQATKDAAGKAFLAATLNFESMIGEQERKLTEAGRHAAALIGNQLNGGAGRLAAAKEALERNALRFVLMLVVFALATGAVGGFVGARLAGM